MITEDKDKWKEIFHEKLIFSKLTNEHVLRLLTLQKIRKHNNIESKLIIYGHTHYQIFYDLANTLFSFDKSDLIKLIPLSSSAGSKIKSTYLPECKPIPLIVTESFIVC